MDLSKIISISGMSGLYKVIAQSKGGLIVESLADKRRIPVQASSKISVLDNIGIYINSGDTIPLKEVLKKMYEKQSGQPALHSKSTDEESKIFFESILPEYDKERVHTSDIRKAILWYNLLQATDIFSQPDTPADGSEKDTPIITEDSHKKAELHKASQIQTKHKGAAGGGVPKKTIGVRKTGTA